MNVGRLLRTVSQLHPVQIVARPAALVMGRIVHDVPGWRAPATRSAWPAAPPELRTYAESEHARGRERIARLTEGSRLRAYEETYGLELGVEGVGDRAAWHRAVAVEPYPASVRARRIAVAMRHGAPGLEAELARAARAVMLRPELHLLGNHVLENGFALACAGAAAEGIEADTWWRAACALLDWQLGLQFVADGGHVERSASYHLALLGALLETIEIARAAGRRVPEVWEGVAARALGWAQAVRAPDGTYPLFNDAALDAAPGVDEVMGLARGVGLEPACVEQTQRSDGASATTLPATGWLCLEVPDAWLALDAGPDAAGWQPGHAHADGLTFELWVRGVRAIVDYGVASYGDGAAERRETRATRSHNTVELASTDSCEVWGAFRVGRRGKGLVRAVEMRSGGVRVGVEHDGYSYRPGAPRHERAVELRPGHLEIRDRMPNAREPWVSRIRADGAGAAVGIAGSGKVRTREDRWHPQHGVPRPARVFEQSGPPAGGEDVVWRVEW